MKQKKGALFLVIIIMMTVIGLISTDIYLPSLPQIATDFHSSQDNAQFTISLFLLGLSISQLIYGPLSEKFGRKPIVLIGISIFVVASLACLISNSIEMLIVSRLFQGIGACSGMTIGRSIIGDAFSKKEAAKIFATVFLFVGFSPAIAPVIGGYIDSYFGWRIVFANVLLFGIVLLILISMFLPETLDKNKKSSIHPYNIFKNYISLVINKTFIGYAIIPCIAYVAYFAYLTSSPFILSNNGYRGEIIGACYISLSISYVMGNFTSRKLLNSYELNKVLSIGYLIFVSSGIAMLLLNHYSFNLFLFLLPITCLTFANGFLIPLGSAGVITNFPYLSGYASGLLGFLQLGSAAVSSAIVGKLTNGSYTALSYYLSITTVIGILLFYGLIVFRNHGAIKLNIPIA
jgi:MFS transporter, DHA1 family, multidrug resistance protein